MKLINKNHRTAKIKCYEAVEEKIVITEPITKNLVILAMTKMANGVCIAGIEPETGQWIRPVRLDVSDPMEHCIQLTDFIIKGQPQIKYLGLSQFGLKEPKPEPPHIEDWLIDRRVKPKLVKELSNSEKIEFLKAHSHQDDLPNLEGLKYSLGMITPEDFSFHFKPNKAGDDIAVRVDFSVNSRNYSDIPCSDIKMRALGRKVLSYLGKSEHRLFRQDFDKKGYEQVFFAMGLTRPYKDKNWLMVIGVHTVPEYQAQIDFSNL
ncbi:MAG: hypothetical protein QME42_06235 [bacterium]|nr:hypothetical protein [bacterium]